MTSYKGLKADLWELIKDIWKIINFTHYKVTLKRPILATMIIYFLILFIIISALFLMNYNNPMDIKEIYFQKEHDGKVLLNNTYPYSLNIKLTKNHDDVSITTWMEPSYLNKKKIPTAYINETRNKYSFEADMKEEIPIVLDTFNSEVGEYIFCTKLIDNSKSTMNKGKVLAKKCHLSENIQES